MPDAEGGTSVDEKGFIVFEAIEGFEVSEVSVFGFFVGLSLCLLLSRLASFFRLPNPFVLPSRIRRGQ